MTSIAAETKRAIRQLIIRSIREAIPPLEAARMIKSMVGLTAPQAQAATNYRAELMEQGHTPDRVAALLDRYVQQKIRERAEMIARTEVMAALNQGSRESWKQAQKAGLLGPNAEREWLATG